MGFPTKNDHFGVFWGYHHFRKEPPIEVFHSFEKVFQSNPKRIGFNVKNKHEPQDPWVFFCFHLVDFCDTNVGKSLASMNPKGDGCFFYNHVFIKWRRRRSLSERLSVAYLFIPFICV